MEKKRKKSTIRRTYIHPDCKECMRLQAKRQAESNPLVKLLSDAEKTDVTLLNLHNSLNYTQNFLQVFRKSVLITSISEIEPKLYNHLDEWFDDINHIITILKQLRQYESDNPNSIQD